MTIRQLSQRKFAQKELFASKHRALAAHCDVQENPEKLHIHASQIAPLPRRPDHTFLSDAIPLFFIGRNQSGLWVARESEGRSGGLFLFRRSAARFARKKSSPPGCAIMIVERPIELDLPNQGNRLVESIGTTIDVIRRRAPLVTSCIGMAIAAWRKLDAGISHALADHHRNRKAIEKDLFRGEYKLVSKNDDDLPILRQS